MLWVPASYGGNGISQRAMVDSRWSLVDGLRMSCPRVIPQTANDQRLATIDYQPTTPDQKQPLWALKIENHDSLEWDSLAVADVRPIAPLLYGLHGGSCQDGVSFD